MGLEVAYWCLYPAPFVFLTPALWGDAFIQDLLANLILYFQENIKVLGCSVCWFLLCTHSCHDWFQATHLERRRDAHGQPQCSEAAPSPCLTASGGTDVSHTPDKRLACEWDMVSPCAQSLCLRLAQGWTCDPVWVSQVFVRNLISESWWERFSLLLNNELW